MRIKGIADDEKDASRFQDPDSFLSKPIGRRMIVVGAGVVMNILFAAIILSLGFGLGFPAVIDEEVSDATTFRDPKIQIVELLSSSPAEKAGLEVADQILSMNEVKVVNTKDIQSLLMDGENRIVIRRGKTELTQQIVPEFNQDVGRPVLGVSLVKTGIVSYPWVEAIGKGVTTSVSLLGQILLAFGSLLRGLMIDQRVPTDIAGPIGVAVITGQVAEQGIIYLLQFTALLSLNLAIINFLPIPALDGGRFLFLLIEKLRGKPMNQTFEGKAHKIGFALLILLVLVVTFRDVSQFKDPILNFFSNLF